MKIKPLKPEAAVRLFFGVGIIAAITGIILWVNNGPSIDIENRHALLIAAGIAFMLSGSFYRIQNENSVRRKLFWANEATRELHAIMSAYSLIRNKYQEALGNANQNETIGEPTINQTVDYIKVCLTRLNVALTQIADLLNDPSIYRDITKDNYQDFTRLLEDAHFIETQKCYQSIPLYDERIKLIQSFIDRIEAEKHKQVKITRPSVQK